jgi:hypothetical protein
MMDHTNLFFLPRSAWLLGFWSVPQWVHLVLENAPRLARGKKSIHTAAKSKDATQASWAFWHLQYFIKSTVEL